MQVSIHTPATIYSYRHVPSWLILAAAAGFVNGFAYLSCKQFVTHITGTVTEVGLTWPTAGQAGNFAVIYFSFVVGAMAAILLLRLRSEEGSTIRWAAPLLIVALVLAGVAVAGNMQSFGPFGEMVAADSPPVALLSLLAFAAGLQNAAVAATTGMAVRTTHLTGPTTDIGLLLGTALMSSGPERRAAVGGAALRFGIVLSFLAGAALAVIVHADLGFLALLIPSGGVLLAAGLSFVPQWSTGDFPFHTEGTSPPPAGPSAGIPPDGRPEQ